MIKQFVAYPGSQVDSILICINAQVMYYPTTVGTMRGALSTEQQRADWPASEKQRFANLKAMFDAGIDPYAIIIEESRRRGIEALLTFRVNDDHGNDFLNTQFRVDHPEWHLSQGALNFDFEPSGADGIYLFNFFTTREYGAESWEPPFEVLRDIGTQGVQPEQ